MFWRDGRPLGTGTLNRLSGARDDDDDPESEGGVYEDESELDDPLDDDEEEDDEEEEDEEGGGDGGGESGTGTMKRSCARLGVVNDAVTLMIAA